MTSQWDGVASRLGGRDQAMHGQLCNSTAAASHPLRVCCTRKHVNQQLAFAGASIADWPKPESQGSWNCLESEFLFLSFYPIRTKRQ